MRWSHTVNDILTSNQVIIARMSLNGHQRKHLAQMANCHTERLGGSRIDCMDCGHEHYIYHSCRNRHCPSCQASKRKEWIARQQQYLLDVPYFHVVFTLPHELNKLCQSQPVRMYNLLFQASWQTLSTFASDPKYLGARTGMTAVLHTWSQNLSLHPHLHCIVPGGGVTKSKRWKRTRSKGKYLFPTKAMAIVFKSIFMAKIKQFIQDGLIAEEFLDVDMLYHKKWIVYAKRPFASPHQVIEYLGRYTHKIAISNYRIVQVDEQQVTFKFKDYRDGAKNKLMRLSILEFIRRVTLHILPHRFVRIRHYGILSFHGRSKLIPQLQLEQAYLPVVTHQPQPAQPITICPRCQSNRITYSTLLPFYIRAP